MTMYLNRTYCDTLEEMRSILRTHDTRVSGILFSLVEECQVYGNRMEAALAYKDDLERLHKERKKLQKEVDALKAQLPEKEKSRTSIVSRILGDDE